MVSQSRERYHVAYVLMDPSIGEHLRSDNTLGKPFSKFLTELLTAEEHPAMLVGIRDDWTAGLVVDEKAQYPYTFIRRKGLKQVTAWIDQV